jgi:hypothetical protein
VKEKNPNLSVKVLGAAAFTGPGKKPQDRKRANMSHRAFFQSFAFIVPPFLERIKLFYPISVNLSLPFEELNRVG